MHYNTMSLCGIQGQMLSALLLPQGLGDGQEDIQSRLTMTVTGVTIWLVGMTIILTET